VFGEQGHPVRATISDLGPLLLSRMLNLNETQAGVLQLVFKIADDDGLMLLDMKDLRAMCQHVGDNAKQFQTEYGNVSAASVGAIQRGLMQIEEQGGATFFGEPMLDIGDFMQTTDGKGVVNVLAADKLMNSPRLYATFLLWMLSELFEQLPEVGDLEKPKLVFFFDEAHLLFKDAPSALIERISSQALSEADSANVVAANIQHIFAVTEQTGEGTRSTAQMVRELSRTAEELKQSVSRFKVS
jgi:DNA helicase HerA-like ATPase